MCLISTYLQMANIDLEVKRTAEQPEITDSNNNAETPPPSIEIKETNTNDDQELTMTDKRNEVLPTPTPPTTPSPTTPNGERSAGNFDETFKAFAKFGDHKSSGEAITLSNSDKWFKQAKIIDGKKPLTTVDTGIYFKKVAKTKKALTLAEYHEFLDTLAKMKKLEINEIKECLKTSGPPSTNRTTTAVVSGAIGRLTDVSKYTGSHKQRFDEKTGKGRGKAGREDVVVNTGYVTGFKA